MVRWGRLETRKIPSHLPSWGLCTFQVPNRFPSSKSRESNKPREQTVSKKGMKVKPSLYKNLSTYFFQPSYSKKKKKSKKFHIALLDITTHMGDFFSLSFLLLCFSKVEGTTKVNLSICPSLSKNHNTGGTSQTDLAVLTALGSRWDLAMIPVRGPDPAPHFQILCLKQPFSRSLYGMYPGIFLDHMFRLYFNCTLTECLIRLTALSSSHPVKCLQLERIDKELWALS